MPSFLFAEYGHGCKGTIKIKRKETGEASENCSVRKSGFSSVRRRGERTLEKLCVGGQQGAVERKAKEWTCTTCRGTTFVPSTPPWGSRWVEDKILQEGPCWYDLIHCSLVNSSIGSPRKGRSNFVTGQKLIFLTAKTSGYSIAVI